MWRTILVTGFLDLSFAMLASFVMALLSSNDSHYRHSLIRGDCSHPLVFVDVRHHQSLVIKALSIKAIFSYRSIKPVRKSLVPIS